MGWDVVAKAARTIEVRVLCFAGLPGKLVQRYYLVLSCLSFVFHYSLALNALVVYSQSYNIYHLSSLRSSLCYYEPVGHLNGSTGCIWESCDLWNRSPMHRSYQWLQKLIVTSKRWGILFSECKCYCLECCPGYKFFKGSISVCAQG